LASYELAGVLLQVELAVLPRHRRQNRPAGAALSPALSSAMIGFTLQAIGKKTFQKTGACPRILCLRLNMFMSERSMYAKHDEVKDRGYRGQDGGAAIHSERTVGSVCG
jgi:hypothetical protein